MFLTSQLFFKEAQKVCLLRTCCHSCNSEVNTLKYVYTEQAKSKGTSPLTNVLGDKIRKLRKKKELTLEQLAELTESSKSYIWELENKNPPRPSAEKLARIADHLDTTIEYLLDEGEQLAEEDAADASFYRQYRKMPQSTKEKIRQMVKLWGEDE
jgi:transcriptional regulator with XRE-family HTH domain